MKRHRLLQLLAIALMLMTGAVSGLNVKPASAAEPAVPFMASVSGAASITGSSTFELSGAGNASHLGNVKSYHGDGSFTGPNTDILIETLVAANGDTLTIRCSQVLEEISPGVYRGTDSWTVIGGTGRLSGATGSGTGVTNVNLNTGTFTKNTTGAIAY